MKKCTLWVALLCGTGFTCLLCLVLALSTSALLSILLAIFLSPGGIVVDLLVRPKEFSPPLLILAANSVIYSAVAYGGLSVLRHRVGPEKIRIIAIRLVLPVAILVTLVSVSIPKFNPLWPHGLAQLTRQETALRQALPVGTRLDAARAALQSKGISFAENSEQTQTLVLDQNGTSIVATPGDHVISARVRTEAGAFPCEYDIQLVLLFGQDSVMRQQYVDSFRVCP